MVTIVTICFNMDFYGEIFRPFLLTVVVKSAFPMSIVYELNWIKLENPDTWLVFHRDAIKKLEAECLV